ncbi:MAG: site-specific DNA-methyltransferase [Planctomycetes bacterium]|nr:site-specific DNA-methyltransferase [Planctomycetota bacterium]
MASKGGGKRKIEQYRHDDKKRSNNPPVGLVTTATDQDAGKKTYAYDPHLDPSLQWAGKAEHTSFEVPTVSLHVHERIDPRTILEAVRRPNGSGALVQGSLFAQAAENPPLRQALDFYKHAHGWSNRFVAGDSLLVMNSLLEKEGLAGKVQMVYLDPPYGIKYGSNFQPFVNKRDVKDRKDEDLTQEPEMIQAFRDTWEIGIHSYLTYLRDRLLLARELLHESGSCFVQISDENVHHVRELMDEVFGAGNSIAIVVVKKTGGLGTKGIKSVADYLVWHAKDRNRLKYRALFERKELGVGETTGERYDQLCSKDGQTRRPMTAEERENPKLVPRGWSAYQLDNLTSGAFRQNTTVPYKFEGEVFHPGPNACWKTTVEGLDRLAILGRLQKAGLTLRYARFLDDFPCTEVTNVWDDVAGAPNKVYVVQTSPTVIQRCVLMTTDPGDLVFDPTCGSGTTAYVAEQWGRRWITCDTSRVAATLAKQRLMTAVFDYYELAHPDEGVGSGFKYKTVPHVTLKSIANNEPPGQETLYDQPLLDSSRMRVTGPFTVEAVPAPAVRPLADPVGQVANLPADASIARSGPTLRQAEWRAELLQSGIRGKHKQRVEFSRVEPLGGTRWLQAEAETKAPSPPTPLPKGARGDAGPQRVVISFGPEHAPLEQRQVELAWEEARTLSPKPGILVFAAFQFDPEAAKDIDELTPERTGMTFLKAQMNPDLLTDDLKKKRASNESFWLVGQPDVALRQCKNSPLAPRGKGAGGEGKLWEVEVYGFDYYNPRKGTIESGDTSNIAMWLLDPDYDGRSLFPRQVFFPMAGDKEGWAKLAKNLKAEIDEDMIEAYRGTVSLAFELGKNQRVAIKIIDDRGIESLRVMAVDKA